MGLSHMQTLDDGMYHACYQDEQGSTAYITREDGEVENSYVYDAFGNVLERKEEIRNDILYRGQKYDQEAGQYYLRARYYNPVIGRFIQEDTYRGDGLNLYAYCGNNPVMYYDPSGHTKVTQPITEPEAPRTVGEGGSYSSLRDSMTPEEVARYDAYWNNVADDMLKSNVSSYRQAILNGDIIKSTGGKINSKVVTAAIDTNTGDIYYGISGMNNNPTRNAINPQMQAILDSVDGTMTNYLLENCGEFNAINNALNNGVDINALRVYSIDRVGGNYKAPCINCQNLYGNIVHFTE